MKSFLRRRSERLFEAAGFPILSPIRYRADQPPRVAFYSASVVGLGHTARICRIAEEVHQRRPDVSLFVISDGRPEVLNELAPHAALLRLPNYSLGERTDGKFREAPENLLITKQQMREMRANLIVAALHSLQPQVFMVDTVPHGKRNELLPALKQFNPRTSGTQRMLLVRDIPCTPEEDSKANALEDSMKDAHRFYDRVLVAGDPSFFSVEDSLGWPRELVSKTKYIGYVVPHVNGHAAALRRASGQKQIVVSFGGGWECQELAVPILRAFHKLLDGGNHDMRLYMSTGPAASDEARKQIASAAEGISDRVELHTFDSNFSARLAASDLAILQGGSTVFQVLDSDIPVLLYAREWKTREQMERTRRVSSYDGVELLQREDLENVDHLASRMDKFLCGPRVRRQTGISFRGLDNAAESILDILK